MIADGNVRIPAETARDHELAKEQAQDAQGVSRNRRSVMPEVQWLWRPTHSIG